MALDFEQDTVKPSIDDRIRSIPNTDTPCIYLWWNFTILLMFYVRTVDLSIPPMVQAIISANIQCQNVCREAPVKQHSPVSLRCVWARSHIQYMNSENSYSISRMAVCRVEMDSGSGEVWVSGRGCWRRGSWSKANLRYTCECDATVYFCQHPRGFITLLLVFPFPRCQSVRKKKAKQKQFRSFGKF